MKHTVIGMGEILWDMLPEGKVLGGAPANFTFHAMQLGAEGVTISAIGFGYLAGIGDCTRKLHKRV